MEPLPSFDSQLSKAALKEQHQEHQLNPHFQMNQNNLSIDHNTHSLALGIRPSIQNGIPIPRNMLSHSDDMPIQESSVEEPEYHRIKIQPTEDQKKWLEEQLGLREVIAIKKGPTNTKNVLRNFGNAQNQYILYNKDAVSYVEQKLSQPQKFYKWVRSLKLQKFEDFKQVWSSEDINRVYRRVYRQLCFKFYQECAIPYVLSSRMKNENTKMSHLRYVYRFVQGLQDPYQFTYFKKLQR